MLFILRTLGSSWRPPGAGAGTRVRSSLLGAPEGLRQPENCGSRPASASDQRALPAGSGSADGRCAPRARAPGAGTTSPRHCRAEQTLA